MGTESNWDHRSRHRHCRPAATCARCAGEISSPSGFGGGPPTGAVLDDLRGGDAMRNPSQGKQRHDTTRA